MTDDQTPAAPPATSPWPVLIPVLVGIGALLLGGVLGGIIGGAAGFAIGSRADRGPVVAYPVPDHPGQDDGLAPHSQDVPGLEFGRGAIVSGTVTEFADGKLTIERPGGGALTLTVADDTPVLGAGASGVAELAQGDRVTVIVTGRSGELEALVIRIGDVTAR